MSLVLVCATVKMAGAQSRARSYAAVALAAFSGPFEDEPYVDLYGSIYGSVQTGILWSRCATVKGMHDLFNSGVIATSELARGKVGMILKSKEDVALALERGLTVEGAFIPVEPWVSTVKPVLLWICIAGPSGEACYASVTWGGTADPSGAASSTLVTWGSDGPRPLHPEPVVVVDGEAHGKGEGGGG